MGGLPGGMADWKPAFSWKHMGSRAGEEEEGYLGEGLVPKREASLLDGSWDEVR